MKSSLLFFWIQSTALFASYQKKVTKTLIEKTSISKSKEARNFTFGCFDKIHDKRSVYAFIDIWIDIIFPKYSLWILNWLTFQPTSSFCFPLNSFSFQSRTHVLFILLKNELNSSWFFPLSFQIAQSNECCRFNYLI